MRIPENPFSYWKSMTTTDKEKCKCCENHTPTTNVAIRGRCFNSLQGEVREWAAEKNLPKSEFAVRVKGGKKFKGPLWQRMKCGDGTYGFAMRRQGDPVRMTIGLDGQHKAVRHTLVKSKSNRATASRRAKRVDGSACDIVNNTEVMLASRDPVVVTEREDADERYRRHRNRNHRARRGHKRARH